ncbi:hypothetical protein CC79DRAFT_896436 [Sarocladium strictum]
MDEDEQRQIRRFMAQRAAACIRQDPDSHSITKRLCSSATKTNQLFKDLGFRFAPGLLDILVSDSPPPALCFENFPNEYNGWWIVYAIKLNKNGVTMSLLYMGSATNLEHGARNRTKVYRNAITSQLPKYVKKALEEGYEISSLTALA